MISYILIYRFDTGHHLFSIKGDGQKDAMISGLTSAMNSFANQVFHLCKNRIDLVIIGDCCIQEFILFDDLDIDIIFMYDKNEHPFIGELFDIIKGITEQFKHLFVKEDGDRQKYRIITDLIKQYLEYWKYEKKVKGIYIENF